MGLGNKEEEGKLGDIFNESLSDSEYEEDELQHI